MPQAELRDAAQHAAVCELQLRQRPGQERHVSRGLRRGRGEHAEQSWGDGVQQRLRGLLLERGEGPGAVRQVLIEPFELAFGSLKPC